MNLFETNGFENRKATASAELLRSALGQWGN